MKKILLILITIVAFAVSQNCFADDSGLVLHYDFEGTTKTSVPDLSSNGITASLKNNASVIKMGKYHVLSLGTANGYMDMTDKAGECIKKLSNFTVSVYYYINESTDISTTGNFLWSFSELAANSSGAGPYSAYRVNAQRMATSVGGFNGEYAISLDRESLKGTWVHVLYRQTQKSGELFINGESVGTSTSMPILSSTFTTAPAYNWIGRPPFSSDNYLKNAYVYDFRVYNRSVSNDEMATLSKVINDLNYELNYGTVGNFTTLKSQLKSCQTYLDGIDDNNFPANSIAELRDAITLSSAMIEAQKASQTVIDKMVATLKSALANLKAAKGFKMNEASIVKTGDKGFRHPGGLHTDDDFARVKQQLADKNPKVVAAYNVLKNAEYAKSTTATWPTETIVRGGGVGENYMNAARGAAIAYQNALLWKIDGNKANANHAVDVLMQWARTTKHLGGDSNVALASGIYGYQFAQAAELMRDYEGWSREDFQYFKDWMLKVWYPTAISFLRTRHGTWENAGKWWQAPGHYWSNWGLCNAMCVITIGILCDDVYIYNQGMSFMKYDQCGTFVNPRTADPIINDGLTEYLGNLIVTTSKSDLETGAYGELGQMNESGRDAGHAAMALGLAVDIAQMAWNQGDDLFSYMNHRLAAGIEYLAAQCQSIPNLPWTNYAYVSNGYAITDSRCWIMTEPALGAHIRPYWGTVIGHYEGIKGVKMPFAEWAYEQMGIDTGGLGSTSGGYDHLGYSVLMHTQEGLAKPEQVPTELSGKIMYDGKTYNQSDLGALKNTYQVGTSSAFKNGMSVTLMPQLPEGTTDTGKWEWSTGETTRDLTIVTDGSRLYRVTYTNENGVMSEQVFSIATEGDCTPEYLTPYYIYNGHRVESTDMTVIYGANITLGADIVIGWEGNFKWDNGCTTSSIAISGITEDRTYTLHYTNYGGFVSEVKFNIHVMSCTPIITVDDIHVNEGETKAVVGSGQKAELSLEIPMQKQGGAYEWKINGATYTDETFTIDNTELSKEVFVTYTAPDGEVMEVTFQLFVKEAKDRLLDVGNYLIRHIATNTYLTNTAGQDAIPSFQPLIGFEANPSASQVWFVNRASTARYDFVSLSDSLGMNSEGKLIKKTVKPNRISMAAGTNYAAIYNSSGFYWQINEDGTIDNMTLTSLTDFQFELIPIEFNPDGINEITVERNMATDIYDIGGRKVDNITTKGLYIVNGRKMLVK